MLSAFSARQPNTFAMWASAYLVLVAGVVQIFLSLASERLASGIKSSYIAFGLFTIGNTLVIAGSAIKYAKLGWNMPVTVIGSALLVVSLALLGWIFRKAKWSPLKICVYTVLIGLIVSVLVGLVLAQQS